MEYKTMGEFITVELKNFGRLQEVADRYPAIAEKQVGYAITRALTRLMGETKQQAPQGNSTFLKNRWTIKSGRFQGSLISGTSYAMAVHEGSRPHFAPIDPLKKWAVKRGLNPYAVRNSIAVKGTKPNKFLERSVHLQKDKMDFEMESAITKILNEV